MKNIHNAFILLYLVLGTYYLLQAVFFVFLALCVVHSPFSSSKIKLVSCNFKMGVLVTFVRKKIKR